MHQRPSTSKSKVNIQSSGVKAKQKGLANPTKGRGKKSDNMSFRSSKRNCNVLSWLGSFTKLLVVIGSFVLCVYIYDKRIIYGFAEEAGWIAPKNDRLKDAQRDFAKHDIAQEDQLKERAQSKQPNNIYGQKLNVRPISVNDAIKHDTEVEDREQNNGANQEVDNNIENVANLLAAGHNEKPLHYHVLQVLTNTHQKTHLKTRFDVCIRSILSKASINLHFFFVVDKPSEEFIIECLQQITDEGIARSHFQFTILLVENLGRQLLPHVGDLQAQLQGSHPYYRDAIFFMSLGIHHEILPDDVKRLIMMDTDLKFMTDIKQLFDLFEDFSDENVLGIAHEQQPVYRHLFSLFRSQNRGTKVGDPPPDGLTGFNSGMMLLDFDKMRGSEAYREILRVDFVQKYSEKYHFKGHLGDQDFFSLASMEKPELFYVLPCSWNKQLCVWWKDKGYSDVFDMYFNCPQPIHVYHGNCNTPIPH